MSLKEIRRRITSVNNTRQITRAMKLVSAAKLRRAQDAAENQRSYSAKLNQVVRNALNSLQGEFTHPLIEKADEVKKRRVIVITGDRGLCGGYNASVIKAVAAQEDDASIELEVVPVGRRSVSAGNSAGWQHVEEYQDLPESAADWPIDEIADSAIKAFTSSDCDEVVVYFTTFVSAMTQEVTREVVLPFSLEDAEGEQAGEAADGVITFSPSPEEILKGLLPLLIKTKLAQAALESKASEHAARMTAMDSATNNANDLIDKLKLHYNRARQSAITSELIDIVGGAEAVQ